MRVAVEVAGQTVQIDRLCAADLAAGGPMIRSLMFGRVVDVGVMLVGRLLLMGRLLVVARFLLVSRLLVGRRMSVVRQIGGMVRVRLVTICLVVLVGAVQDVVEHTLAELMVSIRQLSALAELSGRNLLNALLRSVQRAACLHTVARRVGRISVRILERLQLIVDLLASEHLL